MNYFELYVGDYARDTMELSLAEHGGFLLLLSSYYATEKPLPADVGALYRIVRAMTAAERKAVDVVADRFFPVGSDGLRHNTRADTEIEKAQKRINAAQENGRRGGRPKKEPDGNPPGFDPVTQQQPGGKALHTPSKSKSPPSPPVGGEAPAKPSRAKAPTLDAYLADCAASGAEPIPASHAVWRFADDAGIPREWVALAWWAFQGRYIDGKTRQSSWPQKFRNAVAENWLRLWWLDGNDYRLTTAGMQVKREMEASA